MDKTTKQYLHLRFRIHWEEAGRKIKPEDQGVCCNIVSPGNARDVISIKSHQLSHLNMS